MGETEGAVVVLGILAVIVLAVAALKKRPYGKPLIYKVIPEGPYPIIDKIMTPEEFKQYWERVTR